MKKNLSKIFRTKPIVAFMKKNIISNNLLNACIPKKRKRLTPFKWFQTAGNKNKKNKITEKSYLFRKMQEKKNFTSEKPPEKNHHIKTQVGYFEKPDYP